MSSSGVAAEQGPEDAPEVPPDSSEQSQPKPPGWDGPTYYGRSQLKASPFNEWIVGGYIFLAGLSGSSMLISGLADLAAGKSARGTLRNGRYLSLLAPVLGSPLLIWDLHTPQRFYNMLRIAKRTSPMSIGTWILMAFTGAAGLSAVAEFFTRYVPWLRFAARAAHVPAAAAGAGLATYTATLLSSTSTPFWAAAPRALAMRFGASSFAAGASALALLERDPRMRGQLQTIAAVALVTELAASLVADRTYEKTGVAAARNSKWGKVESGATGAGVILPLGLFAAGCLAKGRTGRSLGVCAAMAAIAGSAMLRVSVIGVGDESARRPEVSFRFSQPENLPDRKERISIREKLSRIMAAKNKR